MECRADLSVRSGMVRIVGDIMQVTINKKLIGILSIAAGIGILSLAGLMLTGLYIGWGPFQIFFWRQEVERIQKSYPVEDYQKNIIFYGASNFRMWEKIEDDLSEYRIQNHGFGGSNDMLLYDYADELLFPYNPDIIFIQTGSNDYIKLAGNEEEKISLLLSFKKQMFDYFHEKLPEARIVVMSGLLLPGRQKYTELTHQVNLELESYCLGMEFIDFVNSEEMTFNNKKYAEELFIKDGVHLNHLGQLEWSKTYIKPEIERLIMTYDKKGLRQ